MSRHTISSIFPSFHRLPVLCMALLLAGCSVQAAVAPAQNVPGGNADRGSHLIQRYGCGSCHTIPGIAGADANVGPPLTNIGIRVYIGGRLRNSPPNLEYWIRYPQKVDPGIDMPNMGISQRDARDIAAYLYTLH